MSYGSSERRILRLGTRGSLLARMQSQWVADELELRHPGLKVELVICRTTGDQVSDRPLHDIGGKGLFTRELEQALLEQHVDLVVHSMKDVPVTMPLVEPSQLKIAAVPRREDVRDVLITRDGRSLIDLKHSASVGTGSLRRTCQLRAARPDLVIRPIRGNIDTRLKLVCNDRCDAVVLAMAGLHRAALFDAERMTVIDAGDLLPAAGQGALALQCRAHDARTRRLAAVLDDRQTHDCVDLERAVVQELNGDCHSPIAALAEVIGDLLRLRAAVGERGGAGHVIRAEARTRANEPEQALRQVVRDLAEQGAYRLLAERDDPVEHRTTTPCPSN